MSVCKICTHPQRAEIEAAILRISPTDPSVSMDSIAEEYGVEVTDIKKHALLHTALGMSPEDSESIARKLKLRESDMLTEVAVEYLVTLKGVGRRLNRYIAEGEDSVRFEKMLTKPVVDMYLGLGSEIRQTVKAIADIDHLMNGPKEDNTSGLAALAAAINASR